MPAQTKTAHPIYASMVAVFLLSGLITFSAFGQMESTNEHAFLQQLAEALNADDIDVLTNLNDRDVARSRPVRPRLGAFPDLPVNTFPDSSELSAWEEAYASEQLAAVALLITENSVSESEGEFLEEWLDTLSPHRVIITYATPDSTTAEAVTRVARAHGHTAVQLQSGTQLATAATLYATASHRLAIDSRAARNVDVDVTEINFLGERVRRGSNSLFRDGDNRGNSRLARTEPAKFLKETLGGEFTQSTVREIIVPGGVALGETAHLNTAVSEMRFELDSLVLLGAQGEQLSLPEVEPEVLKALFDFVQRSESIQSDSIVDIDERGRVKVSSALRDTDVGYNIMHADTLPFAYVPNLDVTKSVVLDSTVDWFELQAGLLSFETEFEVRFLSADNMRIAQTRVALEYGYDAQTAVSQYHGSWGRDTRRLRENLDYSGLGKDMAVIAHYAGWVALFRKMREDRVPFLRGRYEFMQIDKSGAETPLRY
jgi:hypothetical protein